MRSVVSIVDRVVSILQLPIWGVGPAFGEVSRSHTANLAEAFERLYLVKQRAALVVYDSASYQTSRQGGKHQIRRNVRLYVIVTDRVLGNMDGSAYGVTGSSPGAAVLAEVAVSALCGAIFVGVGETNDTALVPVSETFLTLQSDQDKAPNRVAVSIEFQAMGPYDSATLGSDFLG